MTRAIGRRAMKALGRDTRAVTVVEFAMIAPVLCLVLLGSFDIAHSLYTRAVLQGVLQKAGRDSTLENATSTRQTELDDQVRAQASALANNARITINRRYYRTFTEAAEAKAETWTDTNGNGTCDASEPYEDANRNGTWDRDGANEGQGGAKDTTVYTVTMTYPRFFPIFKMVGGSDTTKITATTVLRNQPYSDQGSYGTAIVGNCPPEIAAPLPTPTPTAAAPPSPAPSASPRPCILNALGVCVI